MKKIRTVVATVFLLFMPIFTACNSIENFKTTFSELGEKTSNMTPEQIDVNNRYYNEILPISDGWIAVGELYTPSNDGVIVKYDKQSAIVWEKSFGGSDLDEFYSVIRISDGYIVTADCNSVDGDLSGLNESQSGMSHRITVKFDKNGNKIWAKELPAHIIVANNSGFLAAYHNTDSSINVTQFNSDGDSIWTKSISDSLSLYPETNSRSIVKILNGPNGYLLFGQTNSVSKGSGSSSKGPAFIASMSTDGTIRWQRKFAMNDIDEVILSSGGIIAVGEVHKNGDEVIFGAFGNETEIWRSIQKYDFEMNLIWETYYERDGYIVFTDLTEIGDNIFVTGFIVANKSTSFVFGINKNGEIFWDRESQNTEHMDNIYYNNVFKIDNGFAVYEHAYNDGKNSIIKNSFLFYNIKTLE